MNSEPLEKNLTSGNIYKIKLNEISFGTAYYVVVECAELNAKFINK